MIFFLANTSIEVVLKMFFFTFISAYIRFAEQDYIWKAQTAAKTMTSTKKTEIISKKKFTASAFEKNNKAFVMLVATVIERTTITI